jgi:hypothetical protein
MADAPIFPTGLQPILEADIDQHFVAPFGSSRSRKQLGVGLRNYIDQLRTLNIPVELWIDGSFATHKQDPKDVDLVVLVSKVHLDSLDASKKSKLNSLVGNTAHTKKVFGCDAYFVVAESAASQAYWLNLFGRDREDNPKGIAKLELVP